jgi:hypothetical protein
VTPSHLSAYWQAVEQELIDAHAVDPQMAASTVGDLAAKMATAGPTVLNEEPAEVAEWLAERVRAAIPSPFPMARTAGS